MRRHLSPDNFFDSFGVFRLKGDNKMKIAEIKKMAKNLGVKIFPEMKKTEIIKLIQWKEGNFGCFGTAHGYCDQEKCLFREDCLTLSK